MTVRFATLCDRCRARSDEYSSWPMCRECMDDICPSCAAPHSLSTGDGERRDSVLCKSCTTDYNEGVIP